MDALEELFEKDAPLCVILYSRQWPLGSVELKKSQIEALAKLTVTWSQMASSSQTRAIQSRIALTTLVVTPKLLCRL